MEWVAQTTEMYYLTALEVRSSKSRRWPLWCLLREGSVRGLSSWLLGESPPYVSSHFFPLSVSEFSLCVRTPVMVD